MSWSPDGRYLFLEVQNNATRADIYYIDLNGDRKSTPLLHSPANETGAVLSPNGKWLAYRSDESGKDEVYVTAFPGPGGKWQISSGGGSSPSWSADGKQLYYASGDKLMLAPIQNVDTFEFGAAAALPIHLNDFADARAAGAWRALPCSEGAQRRPVAASGSDPELDRDIEEVALTIPAHPASVSRTRHPRPGSAAPNRSGRFPSPAPTPSSLPQARCPVGA